MTYTKPFPAGIGRKGQDKEIRGSRARLSTSLSMSYRECHLLGHDKARNWVTRGFAGAVQLMSKSAFTIETRKTFSQFVRSLDGYLAAASDDPSPGSPAFTDWNQSEFRDALANVRAIGEILRVVLLDHLLMFANSLDRDPQEFALWTCVRAMLEPAGLVKWLFDPTLPLQDRAARVFSYRYKAIGEQISFAREASYPESTVTSLQDRKLSVEASAQSLGLSVILDKKKRKKIGLGVSFPTATQLIAQTMDEGIAYKLASCLAHSQHWAIITSFFCHESTVIDETGIEWNSLRRSESVSSIRISAYLAFKAISTALWAQCCYFGGNSHMLEEIIEDTADQMDIQAGARFWRNTSP